MSLRFFCKINSVNRRIIATHCMCQTVVIKVSMFLNAYKVLKLETIKSLTSSGL